MTTVELSYTEDRTVPVESVGVTETPLLLELPHGMLFIRDSDTFDLTPDAYESGTDVWQTETAIVLRVIHEQFGRLSLVVSEGAPSRRDAATVEAILRTPSRRLLFENSAGEELMSVAVEEEEVRVVVFLSDEDEEREEQDCLVLLSTSTSSP